MTVQSPPSLKTEATYEPSAFHKRGGKYFNTKPADESRLEKLFSLGKAFFKSAVALQHPNKEVNFMGHERLICLLFMQHQGKTPHPLLQVILWFKTN